LIQDGLTQRIIALNLFLHDIYHEQRILKDGTVPREIIEMAAHFRPEMLGVNVPRDIYIHICGSDLIRDRDGKYLVLEDNGRRPSGVSDRLENREAMKRAFPRLYSAMNVLPVDAYPELLLEDAPTLVSSPLANSCLRPADSRSLQQRLLRAHLPSPPDGHSNR